MKHEGPQKGTVDPAASSPGSLFPLPSRRNGRFRVLGGLSGKLLLLTIVFVMLAEILIYVPSIANYRNNWLSDRLSTAGVAASVLAETNTIAPRLQEELLRTTGAVAIALDQGTRRSLIAMDDQLPDNIRYVVNMGRMNPLQSILESFQILFDRGEGYMRVVGAVQMGYVERVDIVLPVRLLHQDMLAFSVRILVLSIIISGITAGLVYVTLRAVFVRPLQRLTKSMDHFAEEPEDLSRAIKVSSRNDELGDAEVRLHAMQEALSRALTQKQRLADLGLAVSKINHDLRNLLASAQLFLERLEHVPDPTVNRLAPKILATLDRAVGYTQAVMAYGKASERAPQRRLIALRKVGEDIADVLGLADNSSVQFHNRVDENLEVDADPEQIFRVLLNLCRNALQAIESENDPTLVRRITLEAERDKNCVFIRVVDTGPGIPANIKSALFKAFHSGSKAGGIGLGLAIASELLKAHGGRIGLDESVPGTCFCIELPDRNST
ncbi:signal transduction histidine kinase [Roseibium hamelinense]|uniref:histidine kinase n=1 Tax=Roseibium hamelinense TaxID=150831 RepID=A0A562SHU7_9HYPH|nr:HAMP domain-containing sensor histidine kinase [Roseibium hamelinense]MTI43882.1 HAMP domain-containing histidine kinase [Roseibium hamelinense]TWI80822.1 signal transduction histidine kinase [Roseibium hamelinense]